MINMNGDFAVAHLCTPNFGFGGSGNNKACYCRTGKGSKNTSTATIDSCPRFISPTLTLDPNALQTALPLGYFGIGVSKSVSVCIGDSDTVVVW